ncbi:gluconate 2-dehydrogenase subunit 3 family protein [Paraglaciecola chathamensis]|uniref:gluconate 2-dehydrogenase subunit 3 family protein n=1 Tax=Paraglaciecola chathamensis TaxID=368405 RepID=UPI0026FC72A4|nr:gluconate 2-dehydrogenase subunit 3 family protein [Paraglaciecola chathamensis]MDO6561303.1 gluconate 2-dehydrogenase subunit 3 family protein [Paraglaciecola chathamensis]
MSMNRRELLKMIAAATGTAFVSANAMAYVTLPMKTINQTAFSKDDVAYFNEVGEVIIPRTDTPGAKDANVGYMMAVMVTDCYTPAQQAAFKEGIASIKALAKSTYGKDFLLLNTDERTRLLATLNDEADVFNRKAKLANDDAEKPMPHGFTLIKQLTLFTFFTSKEGANKVLRYVAIPGRYDGEMPYKKGDRAWAT